jgi:hypothetical protein
MDKRDFLMNVPGIITHKTGGYGELEIVVDIVGRKGVCYRHKDNTASCGAYASTWSELFDKFADYLIAEGYMNRKK